MKKAVLAILSFAMILSGSKVSAQGKYGADSAECIKYLSYYQEYFKQKSYDEALPNWRKAYQLCPPTCSQNLLINGTTLIKRLIVKNQKNSIYKDALVDSLITLYDQRAELYPKYAVTALNNKGIDLNNYLKDDNEKLFKGYEGIIEKVQDQTKPTILLFDLNTAIELYKNGSLGTEDILNIYQRNSEIMENAQSSSETEAKQNEKIKADLENLFISSRVASCEDLIALFGPRYEANPEDLTLATNIVKMMSVTEDCIDNDLYLNAVTTMDKLDPSAKSANFLYKLHAQKGNTDDAIKYLELAIGRESDQLTLGSYNLELATYCFKNGHSSKAYDLAGKVPALDPSLSGKAYMLMGTIWGSTTCGGDEIARRAPYWVACDFMQKAKAADESLTEEANRLIGSYSRYFPQTAEAFMYDITNGQSYTVVCGGMRATTTVRTVK